MYKLYVTLAFLSLLSIFVCLLDVFPLLRFHIFKANPYIFISV